MLSVLLRPVGIFSKFLLVVWTPRWWSLAKLSWIVLNRSTSSWIEKTCAFSFHSSVATLFVQCCQLARLVTVLMLCCRRAGTPCSTSINNIYLMFYNLKCPLNFYRYNSRSPVNLQASSEHLYGFVHFRQVKDDSLPRGYFQKVSLIISFSIYNYLFTDSFISSGLLNMFENLIS